MNDILNPLVIEYYIFTFRYIFDVPLSLSFLFMGYYLTMRLINQRSINTAYPGDPDHLNQAAAVSDDTPRISQLGISSH